MLLLEGESAFLSDFADDALVWDIVRTRLANLRVQVDLLLGESWRPTPGNLA